MRLVPLPALADNYIWLLHDGEGMAAVVDPGDAAVVESALEEHHLQLRAILLTHHHPDHIGGAARLQADHGVPVYAPVDQRIGLSTVQVGDGSIIDLLSPAAHFEVIALPGHTLSHVAYYGEGVLLCGDTLFSLGCGRLFEGTPAQMLASLDRLSQLPTQTMVCAGHEYTAANGRFAITVDPDNHMLRARLQQVVALRAQGQPTLPVPLASELATNPFVRVDTDPVRAWCEQRSGITGDRIDHFATLRAAKDVFR